MKLKERWYNFRFALMQRFGRTYTTKYSGAKSKRCGYFEAFGERTAVIMNLNKEGVFLYTHAEISKMAIACVACGKPIWPFDPIGLLVPTEEYQVPKGSYLWEPEKSYPACLRWGCEHPDRSGFWMPTEEDPFRCDVLRVASAIERLLAGNGDDCVIISDTRDVNEAIAATNALRQKQQ